MNTPLPEKSVEERVDDLIRKIRRIIDGGGDFIFRGESKQSYKETGGLICSSLARDYPAQIETEYFSLENHVQKKELKNIRNYTDVQDEKNILIEVQHYGGKTSLIDFTEDYNVALFFACDSEAHKDGRVILFDISKKPEDIRVIYPEKSLTNRIISQKSVFLRLFERNHLYKKDGEKEFLTIIPVSSDLKQEIIRRLRLHHNITTESIYYDIHGYIKNQDTHRNAFTLFYKGCSLMKKGEHDEAISVFAETIELKPDFAEAYNNRANSYAERGEYDLAIADYDKAIEFKPNFAEAYNNRGITYHDKGRYELAVLDYDKAIELNPNLVSAYNNRGVAYGRQGKHDRAIIDHNKAIEIAPEHANAYRNRGVSKKELMRYEDAREDFQTGLKFAVQQKNEKLASEIRKLLSELPPDSEK